MNIFCLSIGIIELGPIEKEKIHIDKLRKMRDRAPVQIEYMITAIDKIRSEIGDEVISDALIALASVCKVEFSNYQSCKIFKG